jgi:hypothetical protein
MSTWRIVVRPKGAWFLVVGVAIREDGTTTEDVLERFQDRERAAAARDRWERDCLTAEVEDAERRAGWDPNP